MAHSSATDLKSSGNTDIERQVTYEAPVVLAPARKTLGSGVSDVNHKTHDFAKM